MSELWLQNEEFEHEGCVMSKELKQSCGCTLIVDEVDMLLQEISLCDVHKKEWEEYERRTA